MTTLQMVETPVGDLSPNPWNTNTMLPENEAKLEASIKRLGFTKPILARRLKDGSLQILGGEHRWIVAKRMGFETVPVIDLGTLDDLKAKEIGLVDNGRYGEDDALRLSALLRELGPTDEILEFLPYSGDELDSLFLAASIDLEDLDMPDDRDGTLPEIPLSKVAQTHQVMRFKVPVGDSDFVQKLINSTMKNQNFNEEDSLTNAGNALVHLLKELK